MNIDPITIKRLCKENGTNLKKVSCKLGIPYNTIYSATKRGSCRKELAEAIASFFCVDISYISGGLSYTKQERFSTKTLPEIVTFKFFANGNRLFCSARMKWNGEDIGVTVSEDIADLSANLATQDYFRMEESE